MVHRLDRVDDLEAALSAAAEFTHDPADEGWMTADAGGQQLYVRLGDFPDEDLWSLWLGDGRWMDFTVPPARWALRISGPRWPEGARERLPKNEFHD